MANWKHVSQNTFDKHVEQLEEKHGKTCHTRFFRRDNIIVYYFGEGSPLDQQWIAKIHLEPKSYYIAQDT